MIMDPLQELLSRSDVVLADGAMGTMLFGLGLEQGGSPELWNVEHPELVASVHRGYLEAGAQMVLTNTFGGNRLRLGMHNLQDRATELNRAGVELAHGIVAEVGSGALIVGDIGPSGELLEPFGNLSYGAAVSAFSEQAQALIGGGADLIWIETISALDELRAAIEGVKMISSQIPVVATMTFDTHGRTMMGVAPEEAVEALRGLEVSAVGGNCGNGPEEILDVIKKMHDVAPDAVLVAKSNAGIPRWENGKTVYDAGPEEMARYAVQAAEAGARIIGACCGSTPAHLAQMRSALGERLSRVK
jgi:methionine synthase I (cobalamin-dependent)